MRYGEPGVRVTNERRVRPVGRRFEELGWAQTPIGEVSLRRRSAPGGGEDIYEVKLGDEYLMSSLFTVAEEELARLALSRLTGERLDVVVGGLGLGYTALTALADPRVAELIVVDYLKPVIDWHRRGLIPAGPELTADPRCRLVHGDFFAMTVARGYDPSTEQRQFDAVIVDIDHSPRQLLADRNAGF